MGFLDKIKQQATDVASTVAEKTQETAKVGQLQMQLRSLKGEEKEAHADFGRQAYGLHRDGALAERSGELASGAARIADLQSQIAAKEQEIADTKGDEDSATVEGSAEEVAEPAASPPSLHRLRRGASAAAAAPNRVASEPPGGRARWTRARGDSTPTSSDEFDTGSRSSNSSVDLGARERLVREQRLGEPVELRTVIGRPSAPSDQARSVISRCSRVAHLLGLLRERVVVGAHLQERVVAPMPQSNTITRAIAWRDRGRRRRRW